MAGKWRHRCDGGRGEASSGSRDVLLVLGDPGSCSLAEHMQTVP